MSSESNKFLVKIGWEVSLYATGVMSRTYLTIRLRQDHPSQGCLTNRIRSSRRLLLKDRSSVRIHCMLSFYHLYLYSVPEIEILIESAVLAVRFKVQKHWVAVGASHWCFLLRLVMVIWNNSQWSCWRPYYQQTPHYIQYLLVHIAYNMFGGLIHMKNPIPYRVFHGQVFYILME